MDINHSQFEHKPHDALFRKHFSHTDVLHAFLQHALPEQLYQCIQPDSIVVDPGSYIDTEHAEHYSDIATHPDFANPVPSRQWKTPARSLFTAVCIQCARTAQGLPA